MTAAPASRPTQPAKNTPAPASHTGRACRDLRCERRACRAAKSNTPDSLNLVPFTVRPARTSDVIGIQALAQGSGGLFAMAVLLRAGVSVPKTRREFWVPKLAGNVARDARSLAALEELGWRVAVIWECETKRPEFVRETLSDLLGTRH